MGFLPQTLAFAQFFFGFLFLIKTFLLPYLSPITSATAPLL
jgi:hypothetical protein